MALQGVTQPDVPLAVGVLLGLTVVAAAVFVALGARVNVGATVVFVRVADAPAVLVREATGVFVGEITVVATVVLVRVGLLVAGADVPQLTSEKSAGTFGGSHPICDVCD